MKKSILFIILVLLFLLLESCSTTPICVTSSVTPIQNKLITENLGKTSGTDSALSVLGIYMIGRPDIDIALERAKLSKNADTLINVRCYETYGYYLLFSISTVRVEGDAVKLTEDLKDTKQDSKGKTR